MSRSFVSGVAPPEKVQSSLWFAFAGNKLLVRQVGERYEIPSAIDLAPIRTQYLGQLGDRSCFSAELAKDAIAPEGFALLGLRELYGSLTEEEFAIAGRAVQIIAWDRTHQFCGHCATPMTQLPDERAKRCPNCGLVNYPRLSPAMIVLVSRGEEILLARAHRFPTGMYSLLAGFVEPGESLEETVVREVREEVGIEVKNIRYFGSQPWPFPNSLMIGFMADYAGGSIALEEKEIADAKWFHKHNLPPIPPRISIARKLIDAFVFGAIESALNP
ncbi:NAD(+) diphosphatase [Microcoleus sp. FACHB-1515]|nr:NAD(+) diphosphatase [Microcoleus sp. FACHB-1515]